MNMLAKPVITYSLNIINWNLEDITPMDRKIQKLLTLNRMHHPKQDAIECMSQEEKGGEE